MAMSDMRSIVKERVSLRTIVAAIVVSAAGMSLLGLTASTDQPIGDCSDVAPWVARPCSC